MAKPSDTEPHRRGLIHFVKERGPQRLGITSGMAWYDDPKLLTFTFSRYKFAAKMLEGSESVLECGCGDGFASRIVAQAVGNLTAIDFDAEAIQDAQQRQDERWPIRFDLHDMLDAPYPGLYDGTYTLDVLEHIEAKDEDRFIANMIAPLKPNGTAIVGMPSLPSQAYASPNSKEGHVNCKTAPELRKTMQRHFTNVYIFSMNDEVVHTGYHMMAHYLIALCCGKK